MKCIVTCCLLVLCVTAKSQWYDPEKVNPKAQEIYQKSIEMLVYGEMEAGRAGVRKALSIDDKFVDAWLSLAGSYGESKKYDSAVYFYEKARAMDTAYFVDFNLPYSLNLAGQGRFTDALAAINNMLAHPLSERMQKEGNFKKQRYEMAISLQQKNAAAATSFKPVNLGDSINSRFDEYYPSFTIDDSILVFSRRQQGRPREDFYKSNMTATGYRKAMEVEGDLNTEPFKGALTISADGDLLMFAAEFPLKGFGNYDIYTAFSTPQGWSEPLNAGPNINTEYWESSPALSPDKQVLIFASKRPGGYGGSDLYISLRQANGKWGPAKNMGPNFNTKGDELAPFLHVDNQTLYFCSNGLPGYGDMDVFVCRKGPGGDWSLPENLGYPINTIDSEGALVVAADGKTAYYASDRSDSRGGLDIYQFELWERIRPKKTLYVQGKVFDAQTKKGVLSYVELKDVQNGLVLEKVQTDETGTYLVTLPVGRDYTFTVNRKGYLFYSDAFLLSGQPADSLYKKDIPLQPIALNTVTELKNILFETNAFILQRSSYIELDKLVQLLQDNPTLKVQISGHTDNVGKPVDNLLLSNNRAKAVVDYLISKGIDKARLSFKGFGSTKPVADNKTEAGRARNRRTELVVTGV